MRKRSRDGVAAGLRNRSPQSACRSVFPALPAPKYRCCHRSMTCLAGLPGAGSGWCGHGTDLEEQARYVGPDPPGQDPV